MKLAVTCGGLGSVSAAGAATAKWIGARNCKCQVRCGQPYAELSFHGQLQPLAQKHNFITWLNRIVQSEWVVYAKPPFGGPHQVLKYLARYTHRVAIANQRLVALQDGRVSFRWKDHTR